MSIDETFMARCLQLAEMGKGKVAPNPLVGCVIVYDKKIIAEGYHQEFGKEHAEVNAIKKVSDLSILENCTLYVNLEPCSHFGKTPPCVDLIIKYKIKNVVIGTQDIFSEVNGEGIKKLKGNGVKVAIGVLKKECIELNKRFFIFHSKKRPYVILKWVQSKDGFIGDENIPNLKISNESSQLLNHLWRSQEQAILIGYKTANIDNPQLTTRLVEGNNPKRFVIDLENKLHSNLKLLNDENTTYVFSLTKNGKEKNTEYIKLTNKLNLIDDILECLFRSNIQSIIIEGGAKTIQSFIDNKIWDEARVFESETNLKSGEKAPILKHNKLLFEETIGTKSINTLSVYSFEI